ncbi:MAG: hypothetical protein JSU00_15795 [Acidobacteria bacterium]|nr:hypothetical protein [Acidobacteriota bacterium]
MTRRRWLALCVTAAACGPGREETSPALPRQAGSWTLASDAQPVADRAGAARAAWRATYAGAPAMTLTVYAMPTETSSFDALQKWRATAGRLAFYKGRYFCIAESTGAGFDELSRFTTALREALPSH